MATETIFQKFEAATVPLQGSNLIEASAGTGKTYSIAILVLRLIIEKQLTIKEILMVTFTKAAVAELEERIRLFIRTAYQASNGEIIEDKTITQLVNQHIATVGKEQVSQLLRDAIIYLDETSVLTIHSFCQKTLSEFAFETNQLFGAELLMDTSSIIENETNKFWRKHVTSIPLKLLSFITTGLTRSDIKNIVKTHLDNKKYHGYNPSENYILVQLYYEGVIKEIERLAANHEALLVALIQYIADNKEILTKKCEGDAYAKKGLLHLVDKHQEFLDVIISKRSTKYVLKLFGDILASIDKCDEENKKKNDCIQACLNEIYYAAIMEVEAGVKKSNLQNNQVSFDGLIANLHTALVKKENPKLIAALQKKYKAVFIDEFQDTDKQQYELFHKAFGTNIILFLIGDPKQSIYAWRKADIDTYFKAYDDAAISYGMNENYRSSEAYIKAMNIFFQPNPDFDTFHFPPGGQAITYIPVNSPAPNTKGNLQFDSKDCVPISINNQPNKPSILSAVALQVIDLLINNNYTISKNGTIRHIRPSDIGILVRTNGEGNEIKNELARYGIPAVTIGDAKVLESAEATEVLYILEAMMEISRSNINRALLSSFTGYGTAEILLLDDETAIGLFRQYKASWDNDGVYTSLMNFIAGFGVQQRLLQNNFKNGERTITNLYQLIELLYKIQTNKKLSALELIAWLRRGIEQNDAAGDEYEQRIENDEECVKIVTIHKSKGLEYNIVLAPSLDFTERKLDNFCSFKNEHGEYVNFKKAQLSQDQLSLYKRQTEQENRRLLYVAITRAVYKCFIYKNGASNANASTLSYFTNAIEKYDDGLIDRIIDPKIPESFFYKTAQPPKRTQAPLHVSFSLLQQNWQRMSYTMLAAETDKKSKGISGKTINEYDEFIFNQLAKGSKTGSMLHHILENINFTNNAHWPVHIDNAIKRFNPSLKNEFEPWLVEMLEQVLQANINISGTSFTLLQVGFDERIHEFEFDFPVTAFNTSALQSLSSNGISINVKERYALEGIMNGKIDMLFQCQGKCFILDWKSTFLGNTLEQYTPLALADAMNENNYHLQYLIYTLATKKYLQSRLPNFDYERDFGGVLYLFVRGMRKGTNTGVFNCKPSLEQVEILERIFSEGEMV